MSLSLSNALIMIKANQSKLNPTVVMDVPEIIGLYNVKSMLTDNSI